MGAHSLTRYDSAPTRFSSMGRSDPTAMAIRQRSAASARCLLMGPERLPPPVIGAMSSGSERVLPRKRTVVSISATVKSGSSPARLSVSSPVVRTDSTWCSRHTRRWVSLIGLYLSPPFSTPLTPPHRARSVSALPRARRQRQSRACRSPPSDLCRGSPRSHAPAR